MIKEQLDEILEKHKKWLNDEPDGERADLYEAGLYEADLYGANLRGADLREADLRRANLREADLRRANLREADLRGADLRGADLYGADLRGAMDIPYYVCPMCCPEEGSFIGFKKANIHKFATPVIVKLEITADAKRSSATTRKCRCSKAKVLSITDLQGREELQQAYSTHDNHFIYKVGKIVEVSDFDEDRWNECSTGIHFFITRDEAVRY